MGGGNDGSLSFRIIASRNQGDAGWRVFVYNEGGFASALIAHVYCLTP